MNAEEKLSKAKQQLIVVGVICMSILIFALWLANLQSTFAKNKHRYRSSLESLQDLRQEIKKTWRESRSDQYAQ